MSSTTKKVDLNDLASPKEDKSSVKEDGGGLLFRLLSEKGKSLKLFAALTAVATVVLLSVWFSLSSLDSPEEGIHVNDIPAVEEIVTKQQ